MLYKAYQHFCKKHRLAIMHKNLFGKALVKERIQSDREPTGKRPMVWLGIKLTEEYDAAACGFYDKQTSLHDVMAS
jgi:hypothetical protein